MFGTHLLPYGDRLYLKKNWTFHLDSATLHRAKSTQTGVGYLLGNCPKFIMQDDWTSSLDLNILNYCFWGSLETKINVKQHTSLDFLKASLLHEWDRLHLKMIQAAIAQWRKIKSFVKDKVGDRFR